MSLKFKIAIISTILLGIVATYSIKHSVEAPNQLPIVETQAPSSTEESQTVQPGNTNADFSLRVTQAVDFKALATHHLPIVVDYGSDACRQCQQMAPVLEKLNTELLNRAFIKFADVRRYSSTTENVPIRVIPTQIFVMPDGTQFTPSPELSKRIKFTSDAGFTLHQGALDEVEFRLILAEMVKQ